MADEAPVLEPIIERAIQDVLKTCKIHMASISIRCLQNEGNKTQMTHELRTFKGKGGAGLEEYTTTSVGDEIFHIASLTKALVAVAVFIAIEVKAKEAGSGNRYARFRDTQYERLTALYNRYSTDNIGALPGDPKVYNLIVHFKGLLWANHRLLAPDGTPVMTLSDVREDLIRPIVQDETYIDTKESWTRYSNVNYVVLVMIIEALWEHGDFESFMQETLFTPLNMNSTSIGVPTGRATDNKAWVVDSSGTSHEIQRPNYRATGAEAGALGAYSTAADLDIFFKFLLDSFHGQQKMIPGFDFETAGKLLKLTTKETKSLCYTPLGLYTTLDSPMIGSQSANRLQFPDETFSTYPVLPGSMGDSIRTYCMAGSAIGCNCATAFYASKTRASYAIVVLTDTSGPVDSADHVLRLLLRRTAELKFAQDIVWSPRRPKVILDMVKEAMRTSARAWAQREQEDRKLLARNLKVGKDIVGVFQGDGFSQRLAVSARADGEIYVSVNGSRAPDTSKDFRMVWTDDKTVKIIVPAHWSIDCLGDGDWSNLFLQVVCEGQVVTGLTRTTGSGEDRYFRLPPTSSSVV